MARPDPIEYAERLYGAIRSANFSPISFLAFGNAIKDGMSMRNMPRIAAEPFMRVVGEMLELEEEAADGGVVAATPIEADIHEGSSIEAPPSPPMADTTIDAATLASAVPAMLPLDPSVSTQQRRRGRDKH